MLKNYFLLSVRNLWKNRMFSFINISGLAVGLATSLLIYLWVSDEYGIDTFHKNSANLYSVMENVTYSGKIETSTMSQGILAEDLKNNFPEIIKSCSIGWAGTSVLSVGTNTSVETGNYTNTDFFDMFSFPFLEGNTSSALMQPNSIVITARLKKKLFGNGKALGKIIQLDKKDNYIVTGVTQDPPKTSSIQFSYLLPYSKMFLQNPGLKNWESRSPRTFVLLKPGTSADLMTGKIADEVNKHEKYIKVSLFLQPYSRMYLHSDFSNGQESGGRILYVQLFSMIGVLILVIACINFMNLSTANSSKRTKEIGVRKVVGAEKKSLILQFLLESTLISLLAMILALAIIFLVLPVFNELVEKDIRFSLFNPGHLLFILSVVLLTGLLAGSYPAVFLSSFKPVLILKGSKGIEGHSGLFRKSLVVFQFSISILLIVGVTIIYRQINFLKNKDLGLNKSNLLEVGMNRELGKSFKTFQNILENSGNISAVTYSINNLLWVNNTTSEIQWPGKRPSDVINFPQFMADSHFIKTLGIKMRDGKNIKDGDTTGFVLSEEAVRQMRLKTPVVGTPITLGGVKGSVIGIMKDFNMTDLHSKPLPSVLFYYPDASNMNYVFIRTEPGKTAEAIKTLQETWKKFCPSYELDFEFFDQQYADLYAGDQLIGQLAACFGGITVFISCLGLLGLSLFTAEQRMKEVSIRKVVGAGIFSIVFLLSKSFLKLVLLANLIAWPLSFYIATKWLGNYAYRIDISIWIYLATGFAAVTIALLSMSYHSIRAARMNPTRVLRND